MKPAPSSLHSNVLPAFVAVKLKLALVLLVSAGGLAVIVVSGVVVSMVHVHAAGVGKFVLKLAKALALVSRSKMFAKSPIAPPAPRRSGQYRRDRKHRAEHPGPLDANAGHAADDEEIGVIERGGADAHAHVGGAPQLRCGEIVAQLELVQAAVSGDREAFHEIGTVIFRVNRHLILTIRRHMDRSSAQRSSGDDINQGASAR